MIALRDVTRENFIACVLLKSGDHPGSRLFESHVASNGFSLAQAKGEPEWRPRVVHHGDTVVGFAMYGVERVHGLHFVTRPMIDHRHRRRGFGRQAMLLALEEIASLGADEVFTSIVPGNDAAAASYASLRFAPTGCLVAFGNECEPLFRKVLNLCGGNAEGPPVGGVPPRMVSDQTPKSTAATPPERQTSGRMSD